MNTHEEVMKMAKEPLTVEERIARARAARPDLSIHSQVHKNTNVRVRVSYGNTVDAGMLGPEVPVFTMAVAEAIVQRRQKELKESEDEAINICMDRLGL